MAAYCTDVDLLLTQNLPMPTGLSKAKFVQDAADEINTQIGSLYKTPVTFDTAEDQEKYAVTMTFLKQLNARLATGRLIMALDAAGQNSQLHAYGLFLLKEVKDILQQIKDRDIILEGAPVNSNDPHELGAPGPKVFQLDAFSGVEAFYGIVQNPLIYNPETIFGARESGARW